MKIALILPRAGIYRYGTGAFSRFIRYSPMTLPTLAALVPAELGASVEIYDEGVERIRKEHVRADIVGVTAVTGAAMRAYAYADYFRRRGSYVVMGGVHATLMPREASLHADTVITGHAFETWPRFLRDFREGRPQPLYRAPDTTDFSLFRIPRRSLAAGRGYITINSTQAVFGCPNTCDFCVTPVVCTRYEMRPVEDVVADIRSMRGRFFTFVDPSPTENVRYATELCRAIAPLRRQWTGLATTRLVRHVELMDAMQESGCKGLLIGFESISQAGNDGVNKPFNDVETYSGLVEELHRRGIAIMGCFVHGLDGEDCGCFARTLDFVLKARIDLPRFAICTPFPGTPFFARLKAAGRILTEDWMLYDAQHVVFQPSGMSVEELERGHHWIWRQAYRVPAIAARVVGNRCFPAYSALANAGYKLYGANLARFSRTVMERDDRL